MYLTLVLGINNNNIIALHHTSNDMKMDFEILTNVGIFFILMGTFSLNFEMFLELWIEHLF